LERLSGKIGQIQIKKKRFRQKMPKTLLETLLVNIRDRKQRDLWACKAKDCSSTSSVTFLLAQKRGEAIASSQSCVLAKKGTLPNASARMACPGPPGKETRPHQQARASHIALGRLVIA
jgi:hypothetical protein